MRWHLPTAAHVEHFSSPINPGRLTVSKSFDESPSTADASLAWADNGFGSKEGMDQAHAHVLRGVEQARIDRYERVVDFGCGNALLLRHIHCRYGLQMIGVEKQPDIAQRATVTNPEFVIHHRDIWECASDMANDGAATFGLISIKRIHQTAHHNEAVCALMKVVTALYVYSYDENLAATHLQNWVSDVFEVSQLAFGCLIRRRDNH